MTEKKLKELTTISQEIREIEGNMGHLNSDGIKVIVERVRTNVGSNENVKIITLRNDDDLTRKIKSYLLNQYNERLVQLRKQFDEG